MSVNFLYIILGDVIVKVIDENIEINYLPSREIVSIPKRTIAISGSKFKKVIKRMMDIIGGIVGCLLLIPITLLIFMMKLVKKDKNPIFYTQKRMGKDGKVFLMYKYRSMVVNADQTLNRYLRENPEAKEEYKKYKKLKDDPRITPIGKFLRKTSLDEFPQFINVLKGEMSLVGPRPYLRREKKEMGEYYNYIIECKPGLTGYWQVSGRSDVTFQDRLKMDLEYANKNSLRLDCQLIGKTVLKILKREGAI